MSKIIFHLLLPACLLLALSGCAGINLSPLTDDTKIGNQKAIRTSIMVNSPFTFMPRLYSVTYPSGKYSPVFQDDTGIYFKAQNQIVGKTIAGGRVFEGGLYVSKANKDAIRAYINGSSPK